MALTFQPCKPQIRHAFKHFSHNKLINNSLRTSWAFEPDTEEWFAWVKEQDSFRFVGKCGHFTAHHEWRVPKGAWRAHRHLRNHNSILRLAPNHELTLEVLEQVAEALQAHLTSPRT